MKTRLKLMVRKCGSFLAFLFLFTLAFNALGKLAQATMSAAEVTSALDYVSPRLDELQKPRGSLASCGCRRPRTSPDGTAQAQPAEVCDLNAKAKQDLTRVFEDSFENSDDATNFEMRAGRVLDNYNCNDKDAALKDLDDLFKDANARVTLEKFPLDLLIPYQSKALKNRLKVPAGMEETPPPIQSSCTDNSGTVLPDDVCKRLLACIFAARQLPPGPDRDQFLAQCQDPAQTPQPPAPMPPVPEAPSEPSPSSPGPSAPSVTGDSAPSNPPTADTFENPTIQPAAIPLANPTDSYGGSGNGGTLGPLNPQAISGSGCSLEGSAGATMNPLGHLLLLFVPLLVLQILRRGLITQEDVESWFKGLSFSQEF